MPILTKEEEGLNQVSQARLVEIVSKPGIVICEVHVDWNDYGEFIFVSLKDSRRRLFHSYGWKKITLFGCGYHDVWERFLTDYWGFYEYPEVTAKKLEQIPPQRVVRMIQERIASFPPHDNAPTKRELLAKELGLHGDVDGFLNTIDDFGIDANLLAVLP